MKTNRPNSGFTLVEILIVVVILGILAAIVIPQFSSASDAARASSVKAQLQTLRSQLELFRNNNPEGEYPASLFGAEVEDGVASGLLAADPNNNGKKYLQQVSKNPFGGEATGDNESDWGWTYDSDTGDVKAAADTIPETLLSQFTPEDAVDGTQGEEAAVEE